MARQTGVPGANGTERQFIMASSTTFLFSLQVLPSTNFPGPFPPLIPPGGAPSAAPQLDSRPLTAFSTSHQHYQKPKKRQPRSDTGYQSRGSSSIPAGHIQISLKDDHKKEWIKWAKFGLNHKHRMKAASELQKRRNQNRASPLTMTCPTRNCQACGTLNLRLTPD